MAIDCTNQNRNWITIPTLFAILKNHDFVESHVTWRWRRQTNYNVGGWRTTLFPIKESLLDPPLILRGDTNPPLVVFAARVGTPKV